MAVRVTATTERGVHWTPLASWWQSRTHGLTVTVFSCHWRGHQLKLRGRFRDGVSRRDPGRHHFTTKKEAKCVPTYLIQRKVSIMRSSQFFWGLLLTRRAPTSCEGEGEKEEPVENVKPVGKCACLFVWCAPCGGERAQGGGGNS